jgi:hypothetical protein
MANPSWLLLTSVTVILAPQPPAAAPTVEVFLGSAAPVYASQVRSETGECLLRLHLRPEVRGVTLRLAPESATRKPDEAVVSYWLAEHSPSKKEMRLFEGIIAPPAARFPGVNPVFKATVSLPAHDEEVVWDLHVASGKPETTKGGFPLLGSLLIEGDVQEITTRERELMAWREKVDPDTQQDAVRAKVAELSDEEVYWYTGFTTKANFLKYWQRYRREDFPPDEQGRRVLPPEAVALFASGMPLPNGKYLHHRSRKPLPLPP